MEWSRLSNIVKFLLLFGRIAFSARTHCTNKMELIILQRMGWLLFSSLQLIVVYFGRHRFICTSFYYANDVTQLHLMLLVTLLSRWTFKCRHLCYIPSFCGYGHPHYHRLIRLLHVTCRLHISQPVMKHYDLTLYLVRWLLAALRVLPMEELGLLGRCWKIVCVVGWGAPSVSTTGILLIIHF